MQPKRIGGHDPTGKGEVRSCSNRLCCRPCCSLGWLLVIDKLSCRQPAQIPRFPKLNQGLLKD